MSLSPRHLIYHVPVLIVYFNWLACGVNKIKRSVMRCGAV